MHYRAVLGHIWLLLSAFGICFALLSSLEEVVSGRYVKAGAALILGLLIYVVIGRNKRE